MDAPRFQPWDSPVFGADPSDYAIDYCAPELTCEENPVVGVLLDAEGFPLRVVRERNTVPFGFRGAP